MGKNKSKKKKAENLFRLSPTPPDWSEDNEEYNIDKIVDLCILKSGEIHYKIAWSNWTRDDGSNTSWLPAASDIQDLIDDFHNEQEQLRKNAAPTADVILEQDVLFAPGVHPLSSKTIEQKLPRARGSRKRREDDKKEMLEFMTQPDAVSQWAAEKFGANPLFSVPEDPPNVQDQEGPHNAQAPSAAQDIDRDYIVVDEDTPSPDIIALSRPPTPVPRPPSPPSMKPDVADLFEEHPRSPSLHPDPRLDADADFWDEPKAAAGSDDEENSRISGGLCAAYLQRELDSATSDAGAARLVVIKDEEVPEEDCPRLPMDFNYLESSCDVPTSLRRPSPPLSQAYVIGCPCEGTCDVSEGPQCACQSFSRFDEFAYDEDGEFRFNNVDEEEVEGEVFECTEVCKCSLACPNRMSQRPRDVELEVFKTEKCGWGVRTPVDLPAGKVLGTFTGKLITRQRAEELEKKRQDEWVEDETEYQAELEESGKNELFEPRRYFLDRRGYIFDLDGGERVDGSNALNSSGGPKYSIDAWASGNWSRFLNHCCLPNVKVYTAITEPYHPEKPPPGRLVFVTTCPIPKDTELTIDYDPASARKIGKGGRRKKQKQGIEPPSMNLVKLSLQSMHGNSPRSRGIGGGADSDVEMSSASGAGDRDQRVEEMKDKIVCKCAADSAHCRRFVQV